MEAPHEEYGVVPDVAHGPATQVPGSFVRPPFVHGMQHMAEHQHPAYLGVNPFAPKPFAFENSGALLLLTKSDVVASSGSSLLDTLACF